MFDIATLLDGKLGEGPKLDQDMMDVLESARSGLADVTEGTGTLQSDNRDSRGLRVTLRLEKDHIRYDIFSVVCRLGEEPWLFMDTAYGHIKECRSVEELERAIEDCVTSPITIQNLSLMLNTKTALLPSPNG